MSLDSKILQILDSSACLSKGQMSGYLQKNLYPEELRAIELHLSECPFCSDAVDGLELEMQAVALLAGLKQPNLPAPPKESKVEAVLDKVAKTVTLKNNTPKPEPTPKPERNIVVPRKEEAATRRKDDEPARLNWFKPVAVAAGLAIAIVGGWYFINVQKDDTKALAKNESTDTAPTANSEDNTAPMVADAAPLSDTISRQKLADATIKKADSLPAPAAAPEAVAKKIMTDTASRIVAHKDEVQAEVAEVASARRSAAKAAPAEEKDAAANRLRETESKKEEPKARAKQDANMSDYEMALELYKQKQYGSALLYFRTAQRNSSDPKHNDAVYYSAMCYKATGKSRKAKQLFKKLIEDGAPQKSAAQKQLKQLEAED